MKPGAFEEEYKRLNKAQKEAVEALSGPVMVVAGPGTGKTQVLSLRIANILKKTDIKPDGILCLTFTNSAVDAMKERLKRYIGETGERVNVFTFHSFGMLVIEEHFKVLGLDSAPKLLEDIDTALLFDEILNGQEWRYLRPRGDNMRYMGDLRSLISLLKRERISKEEFALAIRKDIEFLEQDESSISTRGGSKGEIKKEIQKKIESLERSEEIVKFIEIYEKVKKEKNVLDYDDVLESLVRIVEDSKDALAGIRERYLYVLIDEHQDSSRVQNEFLEKTWGEIESPDIFVVGDDRQLIYGFSGASIDHFQGFKKTFREAKLIPLIDNYRSTQVILDASHALLKSTMSDHKLISQREGGEPIRLVEASTGREEIMEAAADIKAKLEKGLEANECAILVPKNFQVRKALQILYEEGLPIASLEALNLFDQEEAREFLRVLQIITRADTPALALSFFDKVSGIQPLEAHKFIVGEKMRQFSLDYLQGLPPKLFEENNEVKNWIEKLLELKKMAEDSSLKSILETISKGLFERSKKGSLVEWQDIFATFLGLLAKQEERSPNISLGEFVSFLEKLKSYGENIPIVSKEKEGIKVLTMHGSKGKEFDYVWIAHMDERSLDSGKKMGFTLPESIRERVEERDVDAVKRKLYVAITRARLFCTLSYSTEGKKGGEQRLGKVITDLPPEIFQKIKTKSKPKTNKEVKKDLSDLSKLVSEKYRDRYVSVSLLNNFFECSWKWYFRNLLQLPEPTNENLEFGNSAHSAIDQILKYQGSVDQKYLEEITGGKGEVLKIVTNWVKNRLPKISKKRESEKSVSLKVPDFPGLGIYGKLDLVEFLDDSNVRVTDFKTGSARRKSEIEKLDDDDKMSNYMRQLAMYSYLIDRNPNFKLKVSEVRLEFLEAKSEKESLYDTVISEDKIEALIKDIKEYDETVKSGAWLERVCKYNSYGKNTACEYCKLSKVYF